MEMKPYYEHAGITIYHGDCRDVLPGLKFDVLITDPPYGVNVGDSDTRGHGHGLAKGAYLSYNDSEENLLDIVIPAIEVSLLKSKRGAVFCAGSNIKHFPQPSAVGGVYCPASVGRHQWGFNSFRPVLLYGTDPRLHTGARPSVIRDSSAAEKNGHPTPKPIAWMKWLVGWVSLDDEIIVDPFSGSGTTLRAAKDLGRGAIGIEIEERYCEIAAKSLSQEVMDFGVPA